MARTVPACVVVMGVSGIGKSSVGVALADRLAARFVDGDDLHSAESIAKMTVGSPLTDEDRWPWLRRVGGELALATRRQEGLVMACSALRRSYRDMIVSLAPMTAFLCLTARASIVGTRISARQGHFMPPELLASQFATLELPGADERAIVIDVDAPFDEVVERAAGGLAALLAAAAE